MILPIKKWPDPILLERCAEWDFENPPLKLNSTIAFDLVQTMMHHQALGLAANQVGIQYEVMAMLKNGEPVVMFNPWWDFGGAEDFKLEYYTEKEGCLSFPKVILEVARHKSIVAHWQDINGAEQSAPLHDMEARCFLHEIDHLNGKVFKEYVSELKFQMAIKKSKKK